MTVSKNEPRDLMEALEQSFIEAGIARPRRLRGHPMRSREGCCSNWPKPCPYHEGWQDAEDAAADVSFLTEAVEEAP